MDEIPAEKRPRVRVAGYIATVVMAVGAYIFFKTDGQPERSALLVSGAMIVMCTVMIESWLWLGMKRGSYLLAAIVGVLYLLFGGGNR